MHWPVLRVDDSQLPQLPKLLHMHIGSSIRAHGPFYEREEVTQGVRLPGTGRWMTASRRPRPSCPTASSWSA